MTLNQMINFKSVKLTENSKVTLSLIPTDWDILKLRQITEPITKGTTPTTEGFNYVKEGVNFLRVENIDDSGNIDVKNCYYISEQNHNCFARSQLKEKDILFSLAGTLGRVGRINKSMIPANINQALGIVRIKSNEFNHDFLFYLLGSVLLQKQVDIEKTIGAQPNISLTQLSNFRIIKPPLKEQQKIAIILSKVDELIQKAGRIIEQTQGLKNGLMQRLLTKGIGHTKFKETEIGKIPYSWSIARFSDLARVEGGYAFKSVDYVDVGIRLVRITNVSFGYMDMKDTINLPRSYLQTYSDFSLKENDILLVLTRPITEGGIKAAKVGINDIPALLNQRVGRVRIINTNELDQNYLFNLIFSNYFLKLVKERISTTHQPNISPTEIGKFLISLPPLREQQKIASVFSNTNKLLQKIKSNKIKYEILKKGLMQKLLTGKIRVKV